jgi:hypothetical protein
MKKITLIFLCAFVSIKAQEPKSENSHNDEEIRRRFFESIASRAQEPRDPEIQKLLQESAQTDAIKITIKTLWARVNFAEKFLELCNPKIGINRQKISTVKEQELGAVRKELEDRLNRSNLSDAEKANYTANIIDYIDALYEKQILARILEEMASYIKSGNLQKQEE